MPVLATVGAEDSGKSIWYEGIRDIFSRGVASVNEALTRQDSFNGELEGAMLCVIEEISLADNRKALARLKEWTTAKVLPIRRMETISHEQYLKIREEQPELFGLDPLPKKRR